MKTAIVIGVFVLVACLHLGANGAVYQGYSKNCQVPDSVKNTCHRFECANGRWTISTCGVSSVSCPEGKIADPGKEDLTKKYPYCCAKPTCRDAY